MQFTAAGCATLSWSGFSGMCDFPIYDYYIFRRKWTDLDSAFQRYKLWLHLMTYLHEFHFTKESSFKGWCNRGSAISTHTVLTMWEISGATYRTGTTIFILYSDSRTLVDKSILRSCDHRYRTSNTYIAIIIMNALSIHGCLFTDSDRSGDKRFVLTKVLPTSVFFFWLTRQMFLRPDENSLRSMGFPVNFPGNHAWRPFSSVSKRIMDWGSGAQYITVCTARCQWL